MKATPLTIGIGAVLGFGALYWLMGYLEPADIQLQHPTGPNSQPPPAPPVQQGPLQLTDTTQLNVYPGRNYVAAVNVSFPLSALASVAKVKAFAEKQGFQNVAVSEDKPAGYPGTNKDADYYVTGSYVGQPQSFFRQQAAGQVSIADAWQV